MDEATVQSMTAAADAFAAAVAHGDDRRYMDVFVGALNLADGYEGGDGSLGGGLRTTAWVDDDLDSINEDPVWIENCKALIASDIRVIGGVPTSDFPDCIAIGSPDGWCCTGTLVAPNVIVTASHCLPRGCFSRVFVGPDVSDLDRGEIIAVATAMSHPEYQPANSPTHDIAVLILDADVTGVAPRAIAPAGAVAASSSVEIVGYGNTDIAGTTGYGLRRRVDVPLVSNDLALGQDPAIEFAAGRPFLDRDSCNGDSGGPAYIDVGGAWYLAGVTSRAIPGRRNCGDGGIYSSAAAFADWIMSIPGGRW